MPSAVSPVMVAALLSATVGAVTQNASWSIWGVYVQASAVPTHEASHLRGSVSTPVNGRSSNAHSQSSCESEARL